MFVHYRPVLLQLTGFLLLLTGMMIYNNLVFRPFLIRHNILSANPPAAGENRMLINHPGGNQSSWYNDTVVCLSVH